MPTEPSALLGRVFTCRFRIVAMYRDPGGPMVLLDLLAASGADCGVHEISLQELQVLIESGLFAEDAGGQS